MEVVFGLVGISLLLLAVIAAVLLWAVRSGQFEDMEGPAWRVLMDDDRPRARSESAADPGAAPGAAPPQGPPAGPHGNPQESPPGTAARDGLRRDGPAAGQGH